MESINKQLNIGLPPRNTNIVPRYARGMRTYQPQLGTEDWSLDFYNDTQAINDFANANGWGEDRDLGKESHLANEEYQEFLGGYPPCLNQRCKTCKNKCKFEKNLKWGSGGKACHKGCVADDKAAQMARIDAIGTPSAVTQGLIAAKSAEAPQKAGMSSGAMVGIAVLGLAVVGFVGYMAFRKK